MAKMSLAAARKNARLNQKDAAQQIGVSNKTLGNWEAGKTFPSAPQIVKICQVYGLGYEDIIFLPTNPL